MKMRKCSCCKEHKPVYEFRINVKTKWIDSYCLDCRKKEHVEYMRKYRVGQIKTKQKKLKQEKTTTPTCERCVNRLYMGNGEYMCIAQKELVLCEKYKERKKLNDK
jgi:hypothetical protein